MLNAMKKSSAALLAVLLFAAAAASFSCINTRSADARVTLFLTMVKSGNFKDALQYVDSKPFTRSVLKKIAMLPDSALLEILKTSGIPDGVKDGFLRDGGAGLGEFRKSIPDLMANAPNIVEMTLVEMSEHMRDKDIDVIAQKINEATGEVHIRFSEANAHDETIIFFVEKIGAEWKISAMEEIITGWIY